MSSIESFFEYIKKGVKEYPVCNNDCDDCTKPNTFAVIESKLELNSLALGKTSQDKNLPYFYSRVWENTKYGPELKFDWPCVIIIEEKVSVQNLFLKNKPINQVHSIQFAVLDRLNENLDKNSKGCSGRVKNEIYRDTERTLMQFMNYIQRGEYVDEVLTYDVSTISETFRKMLREENELTEMYRFDGIGVANIYGTVINLKLRFDHCIEYPVCE